MPAVRGIQSRGSGYKETNGATDLRDERRQSWRFLVRGAVVALATCSLADAGLDRDSEDEERRPTRRAEADPRPIPGPAPSALAPRGSARSANPTGTRATDAPPAFVGRSMRYPLPVPVAGRPAGVAPIGGDARRRLLVAPKHGPPALA